MITERGNSDLILYKIVTETFCYVLFLFDATAIHHLYLIILVSWNFSVFFFSPELKAHGNFSDHFYPASVCPPACLSICLSVCKLFCIFDFFSRNNVLILTNPGTKRFRFRGLKFLKMKGNTVFQEEMIKNYLKFVGIYTKSYQTSFGQKRFNLCSSILKMGRFVFVQTMIPVGRAGPQLWGFLHGNI